MLSEFTLQRLKPEHEFKPFNCGVSDLDKFLFDDSKDHLRQLLTVTYLLENINETVAYFSVLNDCIRKGDTTHNRLKKIILKYLPIQKRGYKTQPAVKVGRFAVSKNFQRQKVGTKLMDYVKGFFIDNNKTGCRFITVDAANSNEVINFYKENGFDFLTDSDKQEDTRIMFYDLITLKR